MSIFVFLLHQFMKDFTSDDAGRLLLEIEAFAVLFLIPCRIALFSPIPRQPSAQERVLLMPAVKKNRQCIIACSLLHRLLIRISYFTRLCLKILLSMQHFCKIL